MLTSEQKLLRRQGCGGSEVAAVVGLDPYRTDFDVAVAKLQGFEAAATPEMERGSFLEPALAALYAHRTGALLAETGTLVHPTMPHVLCTPDRLATLDGRTYDLSIKAPTGRLRSMWGEPGSDEVPMGYLFQLQWELFVLGAHGMVDPAGEHHLAADLDGDLRVFTIKGDPELQLELVARVSHWWQRHIVAGVLPEVGASASSDEWLKWRFPANHGPSKEADLAGEVLALELRAAEEERDEAKDRFDELANRVRLLIGDGDGLRGAFGRITWRADKNGKRTLRTYWKEKS